MLELETAIEEVLSGTRRQSTKVVPLEKAVGSILAEDIIAPFDMPPFDKSAMDGYAVFSKDISSVPIKLRCIGEVPAGSSARDTIGKDECIKVMTGSPIPEGADSVIMMEVTKPASTQQPDYVEIFKKVKEGENVCFKGEEIKKGTPVLQKGVLLRPIEVSVVASLGKAKVKVYRKPKIAILTTGSEIVEPGRRISYGKIYNSNRYLILSLLSSMSLEADYIGVAPDDEEHLLSRVRTGLGYDVFIISGGVSVGDYDLVPRVLKKCRVKEVFHKVAIKPGKPFLFGYRGKTLVFGVPGNPVSTYLSFLVLIMPALNKMMGKDPSLSICKGI